MNTSRISSPPQKWTTAFSSTIRGQTMTITDLFKHEVDNTSLNHVPMEDQNLYSAMEHILSSYYKSDEATRESAQLLREIWIRARIQSAVFEVFIVLEKLGIVDPQALATEFATSWVHDVQVLDLFLALRSFPGILALQDKAKETVGVKQTFVGFSGYCEPFMWLAAVVVRGAKVVDLRAILDRIENTRLLGEVDEEVFGEAWKSGRVLKPDVNMLSHGPYQKRESAVFCNWLPRALDNTSTWYERFDDYFYGIGDLVWQLFWIREG